MPASSLSAHHVRARAAPAKLPESRQISDEELVKRMQDGDQWAEDALYRRHVQYVAGIASRMLRNPEAADDVIQDTFVSTFENIRSVRHGGAIRVWLGRVAVSHAKKRLRYQRMLSFFGFAGEGEAYAFRADPGVGGEVAAELRKLDEVVQTLPMEVRIAWLLHRVEGDSLEEVAQIVGAFPRDRETKNRFGRRRGTSARAIGGGVMKSVPLPVRKALAPALEEKDVIRNWRAIGAKRARAVPAWNHPVSWSLLGAALAATAIGVGSWLWPADPETGPLTRMNGDRFTFVQSSETVELSDRSTIRTTAGATVRVVENTAEVVSLGAEGPEVFVEVTPNGPRRWSLDCTLVSVQVVGTAFSLSCLPDLARVRVQRGVVVVRGERVPGRVQRLSAGQLLEVRKEKAGPAAARSSAPPAMSSALAPTPSAITSAQPASWRDLAERREYARAYEQLGQEGIVQQSQGAGVEDLFHLADIARLSGHPAAAVQPLENVLNQHPGSGQAPLAAFTLGRIYLHSLGRPAQAAQAFERALSLGLPPALAGSALGLGIEAHARSGNRQGARAMAERYLQRFPNGRYAPEARKWVDSSPQ